MREEKKCDVGSIEGGMQIQRKVRLICFCLVLFFQVDACKILLKIVFRNEV